MSIKSNVIMALATAASAGTLLSYAPLADANFRRAHSSECHSYYDNLGTDLYNGAWIANYGDVARGVYCPVATDGYLSHNATTTLNVHGFEASGESNTSRACVKHYTNSGTACGVVKNWGASYGGASGVDITQWSNYGASFPYIYNVVDVGGRLYGFYLAN